jgi:hypothetical protein
VSREDFIAVASRLFSIYLLLNVVRNIPSSLQLLSQDQGMAWAGLYALALVIGLLVCAGLWFFPLTVARKLLPVMREPRFESSIDSSVALSLGLTLIGVWVLAYALVDGTYWLTLLIRTEQVDTTNFVWSHEQIAGMVATAVEFVISLWLIFGNSGIKRLIYKFRYGQSFGAP